MVQEDGLEKDFAEEAVTKDKKGYYGKYVIQKRDGSPVDPKGVYFTLRLDTDVHAREAVRAYIRSCREEEPELARDLEELLSKLRYQTLDKR